MGSGGSKTGARSWCTHANALLSRMRAVMTAAAAAAAASPMAAGGPASELQALIDRENRRAQVQAAIYRLADVCWDVCIDTPGPRLTREQEACVRRCTQRYIDTSRIVMGRMMDAADAVPDPTAGAAAATGLAEPPQSAPR